MRSIGWTIAAVLLAHGAFAQTVEFEGLAGAARTMSAADLAAMPHQSVTMRSEHGPAVRYEGVPLTLLLEGVRAPAGKALRGVELSDVVIVTARDGYRVVLALADTDPGMRADKILLADRADGAPLPATEGLFRLIVEGDLRQARSARMVTSVALERVPKP